MADRPSVPPPPTSQEMARIGVIVRFICGFVLGLFLTLAFGLSDGSGASILLTFAIVAISCGLLSARFGDRFWRSLSRFLRWM